MARVPVAPIHYVERADGEWRGIFERAASESFHVFPAWSTLAVSAHIHTYTEEDFRLIGKVLNELVPKYFSPEWQSPRKLWVHLIYTKAEGETTWLRRALTKYEQIIEPARKARSGG